MSDATNSTLPSNSDATSSAITYQWIIAGIISSSARFIPIPFLDDLIQSRCRKFAVKAALDAHQVDLELSSLKPYYGDSSGCLAGCLGLILKIPITLVLFPFRKIITVLTSVRGVPLEVMRVYLLGRTLDRYLCDGRFGQAENSLLVDDREYATRLRTAFDRSFSRMDMHVMLAAMKDATGGFTELRSSAMIGLKSVLDRRRESAGEWVAESEVKAEATRIQESFSQAEMVILFEKFDGRLDSAMNAPA